MIASLLPARFLPALFAGAVFALAAGPGPPADLSLKSMEGQRVRLSDYRGKVVVLNFWATWCIPCKAEMPMLVSAEEGYRSKGVVFIAASADDRKTKKNVEGFVSKYNVDFSIWLDASSDDMVRLGMGTGVPATAFLDQDGRIAFRVEGQIREEELKERLDWLLGSRTAPAPGSTTNGVGRRRRPEIGPLSRRPHLTLVSRSSRDEVYCVDTSLTTP